MPRRQKSGLRVLKAASSSIRMQILNILLDQGPQSYTELMKILKLNPTRDAGRFAYHLKYLLKADLIEPDVETKEYRLADVGRNVIGFTEEIEQRFFKRRKILVRTSRLAIEEFDGNKIVESLVKEANVPIELAQKIARETEKRLSEFKTKYLTAPLIREIVNAILIEKGLEEYRHKLTRLGLPVFEVTQLMRSTGDACRSVENVHKAAGDAVIEEYTLLNVLPRDIADAHLSGALHLNNLGTWVLQPNEFMHNLQVFLQQGLNIGRIDSRETSYLPPKSLEGAILTASNLLKIAATEISGEQALDFFNIFLAPFSQGLPEERIVECLRHFIFNLSQHISKEGVSAGASLGLEFLVPAFLEEKEVVGPGGRKLGCYADFVEESRRIASLLLEVMFEDDRHKPVFNPSIIIKIRPEVFKNRECESLLFKAHRLAAETGLPYFANLCAKEQTTASYTATGCRFAADWKEDWGLDTLQTGNIDSVIMNLPRVAYEAKGKETAFFGLLEEQLEMALRALEIKHRTIKQRLRENFFPFLAQKTDGDQYFRIENASRLVSFVGLNETIESFFGRSLNQDNNTRDFAEKIVTCLYSNVRRYAKKPETRASLAMVSNTQASRRLAELDAEKYGWGTVHAQGTKEQPVYTDMVALPLEADVAWKERLWVEERFHKLTPGGHLAMIQLGDSDQDPNELLTVTKEIAGTYSVGFYVFNRHLAYCASCQKTAFGILSKCPSCGSVDMLSSFGRLSTKYSPSSCWVPAQRSALTKRVAYTLISR